MARYILWCSPRIHTWTLAFQYTLCDLFYFLENTDIASYTDGNTLYSAKNDKETVINVTETFSLVLFSWFSDNFMKANSGKSHLLISCIELNYANANGSMTKSSQKEILLGINLDNELKIEDQITFMCKKQAKNFKRLPELHH